jgi:Dolichyl-phosphate-mannose-protein mannosyltransferase
LKAAPGEVDHIASSAVHDITLSLPKTSRTSVVTLGAYAVLLFAVLPLTPLWLDEIQQFGNRRDMTLAELIRWIQLNAGASPLPYLLQRLLVNWLGYSAFVARIPSAVSSVLAGVVFVGVCPRFLDRGRWLALLLFLALPVQFRYGMEARVYSQGLLFSLLSLWVFLKLQESYSPALAAIYGLTVAAGLYVQPLTLFPALAQAAYVFRQKTEGRSQKSEARRAERSSSPKPLADARGSVSVALWVGAAVLLYLPWYIPQHRAQVAYALVSPPTAFFNWRQIDPRIVLHDSTGGGYWCAVPLVALAAWGAMQAAPQRRLLLYLICGSVAGPILMDVVFNYFFGERQLLFAMPALILLAAQGFQKLAKPGAWALAAIFLVSAAVTDFRQASIPRDDLASTAGAIASLLPSDACVLAQPQEQIAFYLFFHPELQTRVCSGNFANPEILAVASVYTQPWEASLPAGFVSVQTTKIGRSRLTLCRLRP